MTDKYSLKRLLETVPSEKLTAKQEKVLTEKAKKAFEKLPIEQKTFLKERFNAMEQSQFLESYFSNEGERAKREASLIIESMKEDAKRQGLIMPFDADELAGFWLAYGEPKGLDRSIIKKFHDQIKEDLRQTGSNKQKANKAPFKISSVKFPEIMFRPELLNECLDLLRETDKPCINDANEYLRNKGAFVVWFNVMEYKNMFNVDFTNDKERAQVLKSNFLNLKISESLFRTQLKRAKENYKTHFETTITALKA